MRSYISWLFLSFFFLLCAYVQRNDPDPIGWIAVYTINAVFLGMKAMGIYKRYFSCFLVLSSLVGAFYFWPHSFAGLTGDMTQNPDIEYARESMGLILVAFTQSLVIYTSERTDDVMKESSS